MSATKELDMDRTREIFEASTDFTVGIEEEFALLDPETLALVPRFPELSKVSLAIRNSAIWWPAS